jgi:D-aspartate ligase
MVDVYSTNRPSVAGVSRYTRHERPCPALEDADAFVPWLRACLKAGSIEAIAPTSDLLLYYLATVFDDLSPAMQTVLGSADGIFDMIFKDRFHGRCVEVGQATPQTFTPTSMEAALALVPQLRFPVILKPRSHVGVGGARGIVVHNEDELRAHFAPYEVPSRRVFEKHPDLCWPMIQECVPHALENLYSVSGVVAPNGEIVACAASRKIEQWPRDLGVGMLFQPCTEEVPIERGLAFVRALKQPGIFELELIHDRASDTYVAIDMNPRAFGQIALDIARGHDLPWLWYQLLCGDEVAVQPAASDNIRWMHALPFHFGALIGIARGPNRMERIARYRDVIRHRHVDVVHAPGDIAPSVAFVAKMLRHPGALVRPFI